MRPPLRLCPRTVSPQAWPGTPDSLAVLMIANGLIPYVVFVGTLVYEAKELGHIGSKKTSTHSLAAVAPAEEAPGVEFDSISSAAAGGTWRGGGVGPDCDAIPLRSAGAGRRLPSVRWSVSLVGRSVGCSSSKRTQPVSTLRLKARRAWPLERCTDCGRALTGPWHCRCRRARSKQEI